MAMRINDVIPLKCTETSFFRAWMEMLTPIHKLTAREKDVAARILIQYFKFKGKVPDPIVANELLWSQNSRRDMRESLGMSAAHFQMVLAKLRSPEVLFLVDEYTINNKYIPSLREGEPRYLLGIYYDWSSPANPVRNEEQNA